MLTTIVAILRLVGSLVVTSKDQSLHDQLQPPISERPNMCDRKGRSYRNPDLTLTKLLSLTKLAKIVRSHCRTISSYRG